MNDKTYYIQDRPEMLEFFPSNVKRVLDVGCGAGVFGESLKAHLGAEVWGVEPVAKAAEEARNRIDKVVEDFFQESADIPDDYFDVLVFNDSLEHFPDHFPPLELAKRKLKKGSGVIIASIPNVRYIRNVKHFLFEKDWKYADKGILDRTHLRFFTKKSMLRTFDEAGYDVLSIEGINSYKWTKPGILILRLFMGKLIEDMRYAQYVVKAIPK